MGKCEHEYEKSNDWNCAKWCPKCDMPKCELQERELAEARREIERLKFEYLHKGGFDDPGQI
jgi:hypothetical protein